MITVFWWLIMHSRPWVLQCRDCMRQIGIIRINVYMLLLILQLLIEQLTSILVDSSSFRKDVYIGIGMEWKG
jgi:hypothetical protein